MARLTSYLELAARYRAVFGLRGLMFVTMGKLGWKGRPVRVPRGRGRAPVWIRLKTSDVETYEKVLHRREYACAAIGRPRTILDAGANIGLAAVHFAETFPDARILAVEPEASNFALLARNAAPFPQVTPLPVALWGREGKVSLEDPGIGPWGFRTRESGKCPDASPAVPSRTVASLLDEHGIGELDLLKIDIEGAEIEVFETAASWLPRVRAIMIETHDFFRPGCADAVQRATGAFPVRITAGENLVLLRG